MFRDVFLLKDLIVFITVNGMMNIEKYTLILKKRVGVRQGCPLSTALFNWCLGGIGRIWLNSVNGGIRVASKMFKADVCR